ncbi:MAG: hypothetical protein KJZ69_14795 [Phycisphaerales bacterium]|nr:hypothetical protein [Phycisphaerales bacterium]
MANVLQIIVVSLWIAGVSWHGVTEGDPPTISYQSGGVLLRVGACVPVDVECEPWLECYGDLDSNPSGGFDVSKPALAESSTTDAYASIMCVGEVGLGLVTLRADGDGFADTLAQVAAAADLTNNIAFQVTGGDPQKDQFQFEVRVRSYGSVWAIPDQEGNAEGVVTVSFTVAAQQDGANTEFGIFWDDDGQCQNQTFYPNIASSVDHEHLGVSQQFPWSISGATDPTAIDLQWPILTAWRSEVLNGSEDTFDKDVDTRLEYVLHVFVECTAGSYDFDGDDKLTLELEVDINELP